MAGMGRKETRLKNTVIEIPLTSGMVTLIDAKDAVWVAGFKWHAHKTKSGFYARTTFPRKIYMHEIIAGRAPDHENGNGLDNRRCNLRKATHSQNLANIKKRANTTSSFKGVSWSSTRRKWITQIAGRRVGQFANEEEAARAYDKAALEKYGEFARLNFPKQEAA